MAQQPRPRKDVSRLYGRFNYDYIYEETRNPAAHINEHTLAVRSDRQMNPALLRLEAIRKAGTVTITEGMPSPVNPVDPVKANWVEVGPLAITNGQTYGGARVIVTGRVTAICPHPTDANIIYLGSSRGGVWKSINGGASWTPTSDHIESLAIGALDISHSNPQTLYAGIGEGNLQLYSIVFALNSAPGIYLGIGVLKSTDNGSTWTNLGSAQFANESVWLQRPWNKLAAIA